VKCMAPVKNRAVFTGSLLPEGQRRWGSFGAGIGLECVALLALILIPLFMPQKFQAVTHDWVTPIEAPVIQAWKPQPPPKPVVKREVVKEIPKPEVVIQKPKIFNPVITAPVAKRVVEHKTMAPEVEVAKAFPDPTPPLSMGSSALPTLKRPREAVQTGGFGDPNGVPTNNKTDHNVNVAQLGSFDMPAGPGTGNGTGGAKGAKGVIGSAGFGNGVAVGTPGGSHGSVHQGLFADEQAGPAGPKVKQTAAASNTKPVEILAVPKPVYTSEGLAKRIEGNVRLEVVFTASGEVKVLRVLQGLGYGLDEAAESAARQIRFRPALQDGQPVDSEVPIRITFELAY
jgi:TonB family protein